MATITDRPEESNKPLWEGAPRRSRAPARSPRARLRPIPRALAPLTAALAALFAIAAAVTAIVLTSGPAPPATGAARLVPANALLYLDVSTDPSRPSVQQALASLRRVPAAALLSAVVTGRLDAMLAGSSGRTVDFATEVRPWLGREAAFAVLDSSGPSAGTLIVLDVRNRAKARSFLAAESATPDGVYRDIPLLRQPSGTTLAFVGRYLVLGQAASVMAALDTARGSAPSLAANRVYARATGGEPPDRVLGLYVPWAGVTRALAPSGGLLGALGVLLDQPALSAAAVSVSPSAGGLAVRVHSVLIGAAGTRQFTPSLAGVLPAGSTMLLDVGSLRGAFAKLLAAASKVGVAGRAAELLGRLGSALSADGVNLNQLFAIFGGEAAFAVVPGRGGSAPAPVVVARTAHPAAARAELGSLEGPLTQAFTPPTGGAGVVPEIAASSVAGATVSQLTLAPGLQFDWTVWHGLVVLSTSPRALANVISHRRALADEPSYQAATAGLPTTATSLVFFDLDPLLRLGEQTGLIGSGTFAALRPYLEQIRAIGLVSTSGGSETTTELQLQIR